MQEFIWEVFVLFGVTWYYAYESDTNLSTGKDFTFPLDTPVGIKIMYAIVHLMTT
jgi:hypothetical protein